MESVPDWRAVRTDDGSWTLAHPEHGETCHSTSGAWQQALERYARPCRLRERAQAGARELRLLDIGTGLGLNLAAALSELDGTGCALIADTFERDASVREAMLELVSVHGALDPRAEPFHARVRAALERGGDRSIRTHFGDARALVPALEPTARYDAVFLDPFSPRREPDLWTGEFLAAIAARMAPGAWLSTYTVSKPVRRALAAAGLAVLDGPAVGRKRAGTLARSALDGGTRRAEPL
ncbi:MAG: hypothetical protein EPO68_01625 [Planctomycetota bacterium]|nr:MAG: hypothetical protein EPO68_01625 [Planctomycetota bacterium]